MFERLRQKTKSSRNEKEYMQCNAVQWETQHNHLWSSISELIQKWHIAFWTQTRSNVILNYSIIDKNLYSPMRMEKEKAL